MAHRMLEKTYPRKSKQDSPSLWKEEVYTSIVKHRKVFERDAELVEMFVVYNLLLII